MNYKDVLVQPISGHKYIIMKPIIYKDIFIEKGYKTNGANIPRFLWSIIPPNDSNILPAVIVHDYMIEKLKEYHKADRYFLEILDELGINILKKYTLYIGVKLYSAFLRKIIYFINGIRY